MYTVYITCLISKSIYMYVTCDRYEAKYILLMVHDTITFSRQYMHPTSCTGPHTYFAGGGEGAPICDMFPSPPIVP